MSDLSVFIYFQVDEKQNYKYKLLRLTVTRFTGYNYWKPAKIKTWVTISPGQFKLLWDKAWKYQPPTLRVN